MLNVFCSTLKHLFPKFTNAIFNSNKNIYISAELSRSYTDFLDCNIDFFLSLECYF